MISGGILSRTRNKKTGPVLHFSFAVEDVAFRLDVMGIKSPSDELIQKYLQTVHGFKKEVEGDKKNLQCNLPTQIQDERKRREREASRERSVVKPDVGRVYRPRRKETVSPSAARSRIFAEKIRRARRLIIIESLQGGSMKIKRKECSVCYHILPREAYTEEIFMKKSDLVCKGCSLNKLIYDPRLRRSTDVIDAKIANCLGYCNQEFMSRYGARICPSCKIRQKTID